MNKQEKTNFYDFMTGLALYKPTDKTNNINDYTNNFLNKTLTMFLYKNLPDSLPYEELEKILQIEGKAWVGMYKGQLTAFKIDLIQDEVDVYGNALKGNVYCSDTRQWEEVNISDGVLIKNDFLSLGLKTIFSKYAYLMNESSITLSMANIWKRTEKIFNANDDGTAESVTNYIKQVEDGNTVPIVSNLLYDSLTVTSPQTTGTSLHDLIEYDNYIKSQFYNEIGLYYNSNMKKERLITTEVETGLNSNYPLVDNMYNSRIKGLEKLNEKFNLNVEIEFTSSWEYRLNLGENIEEVEKEPKQEQQVIKGMLNE